MTSPQGNLELLQTPVAQRLLQSSIPARFAYQWTDGTPRVIPIGFHWNGQEMVLGTPMEAPKLKALRDGQSVALCIDPDSMPYQVLEVRGTIRLDVVEGIGPEYGLMTLRTMGQEAGRAWLTSMAPMVPRMARVFVRPTWVAVIDFENRFLSAIERAMDGGRERRRWQHLNPVAVREFQCRRGGPCDQRRRAVTTTIRSRARKNSARLTLVVMPLFVCAEQPPRGSPAAYHDGLDTVKDLPELVWTGG